MKNNKKAFTLIEIMVVVALLWIIALWITKLNFNTLSDRQKIDWFFYKIKTSIETTKNNALIWKAIKLSNVSTIVPKKWKIDFNNSRDWIIISNYYNWSDFIEYTKIIPNKYYNIEVYNDSTLISDTGSLLIEWWNLTLSWMTTNNKTLEIKVKYKNLDKIFYINTISWVIEQK